MHDSGPLALLPVLEPEAVNSRELSDVVRHKNEVVCQSDRGDLRVIRPYGRAESFQIGPDPSRRLCGSVVKLV